MADRAAIPRSSHGSRCRLRAGREFVAELLLADLHVNCDSIVCSNPSLVGMIPLGRSLVGLHRSLGLVEEIVNCEF